jgi:hypothetical protein
MKTLKLQRPEPAERSIQNSIVGVLRFHGWMVLKINGGGFKDARGSFVRTYVIYGLNAFFGFPDLLALKGRNGQTRALLIEVKNAKGKLSAAQERFQNFAALFGVRVHVLRDANEVEGLLDEQD